jgi:ABC-type Zn uptake system ZnuABC Zn-binding protein ZnuA
VVVLVALLACGSGLAMWHHAAANRRTGASARARHGVVAGTSMIACALQSLAGQSLEVHLLAPPGQCPGHFDLKPADFRAILRSRALFRHDYQAHLDEKLKASGEARTVVELTTAGPQTIPENYLALCEDAAESLCALFPELRPVVNRRLNRLRDSIARTSAEMLRRAAPLAGLPVVSSTFQEEFCRWLGMQVVGRFDRAEEMGLRELQELIARGREAGAVAVVGNLQRGTREGEPVARALGVPLVLLSNFPLEPHRPDAYAYLLEGNVSKLLETCHAREGR